MLIRIGCIVEGHGEVQAVPLLVRRIAQAVAPEKSIEIPSVHRIPKNRLVKQGELERAVEFTARRLGAGGGVLILMDSDDDCPHDLGPRLLARVRASRGNLPSAVILAKREYEAWFIAGAASLTDGATNPAADPEAVRGAKQWVKAHILNGHHYSETIEQAALTARLDLTAARTADSFDKCYREVEGLVRRLNAE